MSTKRCPKCQGVSKADATECRWCKASLGGVKVRDASAAEAKDDDVKARIVEGLKPEQAKNRAEAQAEVAELQVWTKTPADETLPGTFRPLPWIIMGVGVVLAVVLLAVMGPLGLAIGAAAVVLGAGVAVQDMLTGKLRYRRTAQEAAQWFAEKLKAGEFEQAMLAVATSPRAGRRRSQMIAAWRAGTWRIVACAIKSCKELGAGRAVAKIGLTMYSRSGGAPLAADVAAFFVLPSAAYQMVRVGSYESMEVVLERLIVLRGGRWYLANGLPDSSIDESLVDAVRAER